MCVCVSELLCGVKHTHVCRLKTSRAHTHTQNINYWRVRGEDYSRALCVELTTPGSDRVRNERCEVNGTCRGHGKRVEAGDSPCPPLGHSGQVSSSTPLSHPTVLETTSRVQTSVYVSMCVCEFVCMYVCVCARVFSATSL